MPHDHRPRRTITLLSAADNRTVVRAKPKTSVFGPLHRIVAPPYLGLGRSRRYRRPSLDKQHIRVGCQTGIEAHAQTIETPRVRRRCHVRMIHQDDVASATHVVDFEHAVFISRQRECRIFNALHSTRKIESAISKNAAADKSKAVEVVGRLVCYPDSTRKMAVRKADITNPTNIGFGVDSKAGGREAAAVCIPVVQELRVLKRQRPNVLRLKQGCRLRNALVPCAVAIVQATPINEEILELDTRKPSGPLKFRTEVGEPRSLLLSGIRIGSPGCPIALSLL